MGTVIFDGVSSLDLDIQVEHPPKYIMPERDYEQVSVPGRNGDLFLDKGSYKNYDQPYDIAIADHDIGYDKLMARVSKWLHPRPGYCRLEDSYFPEHYRMAMFNSGVDFDNIMSHGGRATISFNCKPQRYLKNGEQTFRYASSGLIKNPTTENAKPIITLKGGTGSGNFQIGEYVVSVSNLRNNLILDSELQDAYWGTTNRNSDVTLSSLGFPNIVPGDNNISFTGSITSVEVIPRWWIL